jgi:hypothetical protein
MTYRNYRIFNIPAKENSEAEFAVASGDVM